MGHQSLSFSIPKLKLAFQFQMGTFGNFLHIQLILDVYLYGSAHDLSNISLTLGPNAKVAWESYIFPRSLLSEICQSKVLVTSKGPSGLVRAATDCLQNILLTNILLTKSNMYSRDIYLTRCVPFDSMRKKIPCSCSIIAPLQKPYIWFGVLGIRADNIMWNEPHDVWFDIWLSYKLCQCWFV